MGKYADIALHRTSFRAMNTSVEVTLLESAGAPGRNGSFAEQWFRTVEARFSRFRESSELSYLNRLSGKVVLVSGTMMEVLQLADLYRLKTGGIFNPLILPALAAAGYDASIEEVRGRPPGEGGKTTDAPRLPEGNVVLHPAMRAVIVPEKGQLDLGGIVKSWAVMRLARFMREQRGASAGLINAGGDLTVWDDAGVLPSPWTVDIEHPWEPERSIGTLLLAQGSAATSSTLGRRLPGGHHLIDPRTMLPSAGGVEQATVAGPDAIACEVWAKTLCILGAERGIPLFAERAKGYEALLFTASHRTLHVGDGSSIGRMWRGIPVDEQFRTKNTIGKGGEFHD